MGGRQAQIVDISLSQVNLKSPSTGDIPSRLRLLKNCLVKLDNVSKVKTRCWWTEHKGNVAGAPRIAVR